MQTDMRSTPFTRQCWREEAQVFVSIAIHITIPTLKTVRIIIMRLLTGTIISVAFYS